MMKIMKDKIFSLFEKIVRNFVPELKVDKKSLQYILWKRAVESSADYIENNMTYAQPFHTREGLFKYVIERAPDNGLMLEFGVNNGHSINFIAKIINKTIYGFDSFEGLPDDGIIPLKKDGGAKWFYGKMNRHGVLPDVENNVHLIQGWFEDTLPEFINAKNEDISFVHIDCDIYSSTKTILNNLASNFINGTVITFDEYLNYDGWKSNEYLALKEICDEKGINYKYIAYNYMGGVAIQVVEK